MHKALIPLILTAFPLSLVAQDSPAPSASARPPVVLGVAHPVNVGAEFNPKWEADQMIRSLNPAVGDTGAPSTLEAVPLQGSDMKKVANEARDRQCEYVLFTTVTVDRILTSKAGTRAGVQSPVGSREGGGSSKLSVQYVIAKPGETKPLTRGAVLTPNNLDGYDINRALQTSLQDLAIKVNKDIQKLSSREQ